MAAKDEPGIVFELTPETKEKLKAFSCADSWQKAMEQFFAFWETENDPRKAGSIVAHGLVRNAARVAVFGAVCDGREPRKDLWMELCSDHFHEAVMDVNGVMKVASLETIQKEEKLCEDCPPADYPTDKTRCESCPRRRIDRTATEQGT